MYFSQIKDLAGIHQPKGIQAFLDRFHDIQRSWSEFLLQKALLSETDSMLSLRLEKKILDPPNLGGH